MQYINNTNVKEFIEKFNEVFSPGDIVNRVKGETKINATLIGVNANSNGALIEFEGFMDVFPYLREPAYKTIDDKLEISMECNSETYIYSKA